MKYFVNIAVPFFFERLLEEEEKLYLYVVDLLASEYGWTDEYIENLSFPYTLQLIKTLKRRKDMEDQICQLNVAKGMMGKISSNSVKKPDFQHSEEEWDNLQKLAKKTGSKIKPFEESK